MLCEECGGITDVIDSRPTNASDHFKGSQFESTRRRIACRDCGHRSSTYEFHSADIEKMKSEAEKTLEKISDLI